MTITAPLFLPVPLTGAPQPVDIVQIVPDDFLDAGVFTEVAETLLSGFRALGYGSVLRVNGFRSGTPAVVLAAHLIHPQDAPRVPSGVIIYNLEQIRPGAWAANPGYLEVLGRHTVWDCNADSAQAITAATGNPDVHHVGLGFAPELARIAPEPVQDIDVLFYGSLTPRRQAVLETLIMVGLRVHVAFGVYGAARDALIARAKLVLNLHAHDGWGFEIVRVSYLLTNRKAVVCEADDPSEIEPDLRDAVLGVPYDQLGEACLHLLQDDLARDHLAARGHAAFRRREQTTVLHAALRLPRPEPGAAPR